MGCSNVPPGSRSRQDGAPRTGTHLQSEHITEAPCALKLIPSPECLSNAAFETAPALARPSPGPAFSGRPSQICGLTYL